MILRCVLILITFFGGLHSAFAQRYDDNLITAIDYFNESSETPLSLPQVQQLFAAGQGTRAQRQYLTFGISRHATWIRIRLNNPGEHSIHSRLTTGQIWVDTLDIYQQDSQTGLHYWHSGDKKDRNNHLLPGIGFVFDVNVSPGLSYIYIRGKSADPLTLPIRLQSGNEARNSDLLIHIATGVLYGILLTLVGYNLLLYITLKQPDALYYSLYISCFIMMNLGYNGFGFNWLYPHSTWLQNYSTLFFMVAHGVCGLIFVAHFLLLKERMPRLNRAIYIYAWAALLLIVALIVLQKHFWGAFVAFSYLSVTTLLMILIGIINLGKVNDARYFLLAVCCSMIGLLITTLSVWGVIPYTNIAFDAAEYGVVCEAIILAIILAIRIKHIERERSTARYLSSYDPLTKLYNRRSFMEAGNKLLQSTDHDDSALSLVMLDIDHFKKINDTYGHHVGDLALTHIATVIKKCTSSEHIIARWGGEEIVILLVNHNLSEALAYAEYIRDYIEQTPLDSEGGTIGITASFGVAVRQKGQTLEQLFQLADKSLYVAKDRGRNCVEPRFQM